MSEIKESATQIEMMNPYKLKPYDKNPRKHDKNIDVIEALILKYGFKRPVAIDQYDRIIAGHGRVMAAKNLNMLAVPCIREEVADEKDYINRVLADNKVSELSSWDNKLLQDCAELLGDIREFDVPGFTDKEIDKLFGFNSESTSTTPDAADFGDAGEIEEGDDDNIDDQALRHTKKFIFTIKELKYVTSKLKAIKKEHDFKTEAEALIKALEPYKGLPKVTRRASEATAVEE